MKRSLVIVVVLGLAVVVGGLIFVYLGGFSSVGGTNPGGSPGASADGNLNIPRDVVAIGRLKPADGIFTLAALVGDRLKSLNVQEGADVAQGQTLGYLDSRDLRQLEIDSLNAQVKEAKARRAAETELADSRITSAELAVKQAESLATQIETQQLQVDLLRKRLEIERKHYDKLAGVSEELVSLTERETQELLVEKTAVELAAAEAMLKKLMEESVFAVTKANADLAAAKAAKTQVLSAIPVESLEKGLELAQAQFERTELTSPTRGKILKIFTQAGELITQRPILQVADPSRMVCVAEVYEADVKRVREGQAVVIHSRALPAPADRDGLKGRVTRIGQMVLTPELSSLDPFAPADRHVVEVRVELDAASSRLAAGLINLQVDVTFLSSGSP